MAYGVRPQVSGMPQVVKFEKKRAYEIIAEQISDMITAGELCPGDRLPNVRELADLFGVSKVVVSEALRVLSAIGLVETRHGSGTYVLDHTQQKVFHAIELYVTLSAESVHKVYELRRIVEPPLVRLATERIRPGQLKDLHAIVAKMHRCGLVDKELLEADVEFHHRILCATNNEVAATITRALHRLTGDAWLGVGAPRDVSDKICHAHEEILRALESRDGVAAERAMRSHLEASVEDLRRMDGSDLTHIDGEDRR